eukprot:CAMPEP_0181414646 /NCGR_PEP_ID=MMETSP1110-20121109/9612_1 /TAXON_ID=174948 /ORGANISM="Symbiodinium sp., Strain CCMP421" /LENGTH=406 /DNA_ID=CAMNT_0023537531 /DNA_START=20 /DNA_END=1237 /DNA_ORIENTATION=-
MGSSSHLVAQEHGGEFLCEDARRHQRHYMFAAFGIVGCYKICTVLASVMTWRMWLFYNGVTVLVLLIAHLSAKKPEALWVDFVYAVISFVLLLHTSRLYETLILQELMPSGSSEVDLLCAFIFHSQIMVSMGHHPAVLVAWGLAVHCSCWMTNNADLQMDIKIVLSVGFLMYASTHQSQIQLRDTRLESEAELSRFRKREEHQQLQRLEAVRRREQMERMVTLVFNQVKAPLLLAKSELSRPGDAKDILACAQGRIQQLWSLLSGYQTEMQKQFDVCPDSARSARRAEKAFRGTMSEPAADAESQSSASASGSPHFPDAKQREDFHQRRRTKDSNWTESCVALMEASCIQLGVDVDAAPWKLRWIRIELDGRQSSCLSSLLTPTDMFHFRRWLEPEINRFASRQPG